MTYKDAERNHQTEQRWRLDRVGSQENAKRSKIHNITMKVFMDATEAEQTLLSEH